MTQVIIDTSAYSAFRRGLAAVRPYFIHSNDILVPVIVLGELRSGFAVGTRQTDNERLLQEFLSLSNVSVVDVADPTTHVVAKLYSQLRRAGTPIGQNDLWIAALAMEHKAQLLTLDKDFACVEGLELISL